ncbi:NADPH-dependent F420 reductase [Streptomyces sp. FH025]|uniref:NADPH-dependent F420 reductase n=1 Tax=Streptomyces sp. FH025 TaxID=2815937 RepID=UPI001A9F34AB|nr:NAD(P)-binding domain-containing protein [Streptomyces sp. FH025]MBO1418905.1 NAD(P)-binding domain-containing protein [Streptomyces sp. FH025]
MRIGIVGTGAMAGVLGGRWVRAGHEVMVGGRDAGRTARTAALTGARAGTVGQAVRHGEDVVLLAVPYAAAPALAAAHAGALAGRVVVDCSNPVGPGFTLTTGTGPSAAERIAAAAPAARVVKAFNLCHVSVWGIEEPVFEGGALAVPLCGDDDAALKLVGALVRDVGCEPLAAGPLARAHLLEATAALLIGLWVGEGADARAIAPPLAYAVPREG